MKKKKWSVSEVTLDKLWSKAIHEKYYGLCALCFRDNCQAHHIIKRRNRVLRWDKENGILLCADCHREAHEKPFTFYEATKNIINYHYLKNTNTTLVEYCHAAGITKDEFRVKMKMELINDKS